MADFEMKANDLLPVIEAILTLEDGSIPALSGTTVSFIMAKEGELAKVNAAASIVDAATGKVRYTWLLGDTNVPGTYRAEWEVIFPGPKPRTFPTTTYHTIAIYADLDAGGV